MEAKKGGLKMKCLIVDDEPIAIDGVVAYVNKVSFLTVEATCRSAIEAGEILKTHDIDLLFLDINMPYLSGLEFLESLENAPLTIFTTAYSEYALDGFRLQVVDYLLKPIGLPRFRQAVDKAYATWTSQLTREEEEENQFYYIRQSDTFVKLEVESILYIESMQNYLKIHTLNDKYVIHQTMQSIEVLLPIDAFFRIHKSYLINMRHLISISNNKVLVGEIELPLSRYRKDELLKKTVFDKLISK